MSLRTEQQRKQICATCPIARTADLLGDSVSLLIVRDLLKGPQRFSQLEHALEGVSSRTLASRLKKLEKDGLVTRREPRTRSGHIDYALTKKGTGLGTIVKEMGKYGKKYL